MTGQLQHLEPAGDIQLAPAVHLGDQGVTQVQRAKHSLGHLIPIPLVNLLDRHDSQQLVSGVAQRDLLIQADVGARIHWQRDGDRE